MIYQNRTNEVLIHPDPGCAWLADFSNESVVTPFIWRKVVAMVIESTLQCKVLHYRGV